MLCETDNSFSSKIEGSDFVKHILFLLPDLRFGGLEMSLINLINSINSIDQLKITILMYGTQYDLISKLKKNDSIDIKIIKMNNTFKTVVNSVGRGFGKHGTFIRDFYINKFRAAMFIKKNSNRYDYVINYHAACGSNIVKVANIKNTDKLIMWYHGSSYNKAVFNDTNVYLHKNIVVVSEGCLENIVSQNKRLKDKITVINNIIPYKEIIAKSNCVQNVFGKEFAIVTCGRIHREKGIDTVIEACKVLKNKITSFKWYIIGNATEDTEEYEQSIKEMINNYNLENELILLGGKLNPYPYFAQCDLYVQPSREESFGITIAEAQICGAAVVSTETVGARHLIKDGETGIITDNNPTALADAIFELYGNAEKRKYLSENAKKIDFEDSNKKIISKFYNLIGVTTDNE